MHTHTAWWHEATFYAVYPLGYCDALGAQEPGKRVESLIADLDRIAGLGFGALNLGPVFASGSHGYDTLDYFRVDSRLGSDDDLARLVGEAHERGMQVVVDGVYNHVGRGFWAFERLRREGSSSSYRDWFRGVDFGKDNRFGDGFVYEGWEGVDELVALNHAHEEVRAHLLDAAAHAIERYGCDGIRLDVAYLLPFDFQSELSQRLHGLRDDVWLLGEVIHGDYASFLADGMLDSITNYECYKGLWSSFNDQNFHEIGHSLSRLFGPGGLLTGAGRSGRLPYTFADNHDVSRIASTLRDPGHLFPLYGLLWTMPGIPSVYYGSEYALEGRKEDGDTALRPPATVLERVRESERGAALAHWIAKLNAARAGSAALRLGSYHEIAVDSTSLVFERVREGETVLVAVNAEGDPATVSLPAGTAGEYASFFDATPVRLAGDTPGLAVPAYGTRVLRRID